MLWRHKIRSREMKKLMERILANSVIAAVRSRESFDEAVKSGSELIFDLAPDISDIAEKASKCHAAGKRLFIHLDLASGIGKDKSGIEYVRNMGADGIISTRANIIKLAREVGLHTVQRFFAVDSQSVATAAEARKNSKADMIEIMPGVIPKVISDLCKLVSVPIIAGGLIESAEEIESVIAAGAAAVSTGKKTLWKR